MTKLKEPWPGIRQAPYLVVEIATEQMHEIPQQSEPSGVVVRKMKAAAAAQEYG